MKRQNETLVANQINLNESLVETIKNLVGRELFGLVKSQTLGRYDDLTSTECTEAIVGDLLVFTERKYKTVEKQLEETREQCSVEHERHKHYKSLLKATREDLKVSNEEVER